MDKVFVILNDTECEFFKLTNGKGDTRYLVSRKAIRNMPEAEFAEKTVHWLKLDAGKRYELVLVLPQLQTGSELVELFTEAIKPASVAVLNRAQFEAVGRHIEEGVFLIWLDDDTMSVCGCSDIGAVQPPDRYLFMQLCMHIFDGIKAFRSAEEYAEYRALVPKMYAADGIEKASTVPGLKFLTAPYQLKELAKSCPCLERCYEDFARSKEGAVMLCGPGAEKYPLLADAFTELFEERGIHVIANKKVQRGEA